MSNDQSYNNFNMIGKKNILGVDITDATKNEVLEYIIKNLENLRKKLFIVTPNPEILVLSSKNSSFKNVLNSADLASPDGIGVLIAGKFLGQPLKERFTGVDLIENLCNRVAEKPITVGFLGGRDGVAEKTVECLRKKHPKLKIAFVGEEWPSEDFFTKNQYKVSSIKHKEQENIKDVGKNFLNTEYLIHNTGIDILFVAFGAPKQEFWISENLDKIPVRVAIGVGGAFDYISGKVPRAPGFIRGIGLEWLFRLVVQPWRIKRQIALLQFIWLVFRERINQK